MERSNNRRWRSSHAVLGHLRPRLSSSKLLTHTCSGDSIIINSKRSPRPVRSLGPQDFTKVLLSDHEKKTYERATAPIGRRNNVSCHEARIKISESHTKPLFFDNDPTQG